MTEQEMVEAYAAGKLPKKVTVMEVPVRRDPAGGYLVLVGKGKPGDARRDEEYVTLKTWYDIRPGLVAGYAPKFKRLVVGEWVSDSEAELIKKRLEEQDDADSVD